MFDDNQGATALVENPIHRQRSKHIDFKNRFVRDECNQGRFKVVYLSSE